MASLLPLVRRLQARKGTAAFVVALLVVLRRLWRRHRSWEYSLTEDFVQSLPSHWLLGAFFRQSSISLVAGLALLGFSSQNGHLDYLLKLHHLYGKTFVAKSWFAPWWVLTTDPRNVEHILSTRFENYPKGKWIETILAESLGRGFFNVDGQEWYNQRRPIRFVLRF